MARPTSQTISCPQCGQPFNAILEQVLDVSQDPSAKDRLLSGRLNIVSCPHCGFQGMVGTPLFYHDSDKQLAIVYIPMELNLETTEREKLIGDMTRAVMQNMPEDAPKGYLLQPNTALTMQGLIEQVLEADGITREMLDNERRKVELLDELTQVSKEEAEQLLDENEDLIDRTFLELMTAAAQSASQQGDSRTSLRLLNLRSQLMETTEAGQELKQEEDAIREASQELQAIGENLTREKFVDLVVEAADNPTKVRAYAMLGRTILDYSTFQTLSQRIDKAKDPEKKANLEEARELMLAIAAEYEEQSRAVVEEAVNTLRTLLTADDLQTALQNNIQRIDQVFLEVLQANIEEARRTGNVEASSRLQQIQDAVMQLVQASAPPEIQFINELLSAETDSRATELLAERQDMVSPDLVAVMGELSNQLRQAGNEPVAARLDDLRAQVEKMI